MGVSEYVAKNFSEHEEEIRNSTIDPDGLLWSDKGNTTGTYLASVVVKPSNSPNTIVLPMYAGTCVGKDRIIKDRIQEHAVNWVVRNPEMYTGILREELGSSVKYRFDLIAESKDYSLCKQCETLTIFLQKTYLQMTPFSKHHKSSYAQQVGIDICCEYQFRRQAFLYALMTTAPGIMKIGETDELNIILARLLDLKHKRDWKEPIATNESERILSEMKLRSELEKGSEEYRLVAQLVNKRLGVAENKRGATYPWIMHKTSQIIANTSKLD